MQTTDDAVATATIIAAVIAGAIAFFTTILTKEQKTSEFRQAWIDAIRADIADFIGSIKTIGAILLQISRTDGDAAAIAKLTGIEDEVQKLAAAYYRVRLRLNQEKDTELLGKLESVYWLFSDVVEVEEGGARVKKLAILVPGVVEARVQEVLTKAHGTLKTEWERVKKGEPAFYITKRVSLVLLVAGISVLVIQIARTVDWPF